MILCKYSIPITDVAFCSALKTTSSPSRSNLNRRRRRVLLPSSSPHRWASSFLFPTGISVTLASFSVARGFFTRRRPIYRPLRTIASLSRTTLARGLLSSARGFVSVARGFIPCWSPSLPSFPSLSLPLSHSLVSFSRAASSVFTLAREDFQKYPRLSMAL